MPPDGAASVPHDHIPDDDDPNQARTDLANSDNPFPNPSHDVHISEEVSHILHIDIINRPLRSSSILSGIATVQILEDPFRRWDRNYNATPRGIIQANLV